MVHTSYTEVDQKRITRGQLRVPDHQGPVIYLANSQTFVLCIRSRHFYRWKHRSLPSITKYEVCTSGFVPPSQYYIDSASLHCHAGICGPGIRRQGHGEGQGHDTGLADLAAILTRIFPTVLVVCTVVSPPAAK